jgi:hypothetical protein
MESHNMESLGSLRPFMARRGDEVKATIAWERENLGRDGSACGNHAIAGFIELMRK